jgi:hypothetical protein
MATLGKVLAISGKFEDVQILQPSNSTLASIPFRTLCACEQDHMNKNVCISIICSSQKLEVSQAC